MHALHELIETAQSNWITSIFSWLIALLLSNGAIVHVLNIFGKGKVPWSEFPPAWRFMDVVLLAFNVVVVTGLVLRQPWSVYLLYVGIVVLQIIPYTVFRRHFVTQPEDHGTLNSLVAGEVLLLLVFAGLIIWQGSGGGV